jgi:hypothetical protein
VNDKAPIKKILLLSANPLKTGQLRVDEEMREIKEGLRRSKYREQFVIESAEAVRYRDIRRAILDSEPNIVHFSGHGEGEEGLVFEDESGQIRLVGAEALSNLFELFADKVECVVLNACYSQVQAEAIARYIPYVVGMKKAIGDKAAIEFAIGFYDALGAGKTVEFSYKLGCNAIEIAGIDESLIPQLLNRCEKIDLPIPQIVGDNLASEPHPAPKRKRSSIIGIGGGIAALLLWGISSNFFRPQQPPFSLNNQEIPGRLSEGDKINEMPSPLIQPQNTAKFTYFDEYFFQGTQGQKIQLEMTSEEFDPYLELYAPNQQKLVSNDDISRGNPNAKIEFTLLESGLHRVVASSSQPQEKGTYNLRGKLIDR